MNQSVQCTQPASRAYASQTTHATHRAWSQDITLRCSLHTDCSLDSRLLSGVLACLIDDPMSNSKPRAGWARSCTRCSDSVEKAYVPLARNVRLGAGPARAEYLNPVDRAPRRLAAPPPVHHGQLASRLCFSPIHTLRGAPWRHATIPSARRTGSGTAQCAAFSPLTRRTRTCAA
jgi:hypothetical protein